MFSDNVITLLMPLLICHLLKCLWPRSRFWSMNGMLDHLIVLKLLISWFKLFKGHIAVRSSLSVDFTVQHFDWLSKRASLIPWFNFDLSHKCFNTGHIVTTSWINLFLYNAQSVYGSWAFSFHGNILVSGLMWSPAQQCIYMPVYGLIPRPCLTFCLLLQVMEGWAGAWDWS